MSPPSYAVPVPLFETEERRRVLLDAYFIDEHVRRRDDPRQVADVHVADPTNPLPVTPSRSIAFVRPFSVTLKRPTFDAHERHLRVRIA